MKLPTQSLGLNILCPKIDGGLIRDEQAAAGIFHENFAQRIVNSKIAEDIPARAVEKIRDRAEDFALRSFAGAGSAEQEDGPIDHIVPFVFSGLT